MLSKVTREDENLPPRKKAKSTFGYATEWKLWSGKKLCARYFLFGYDYYYFQNSGASNDYFFLNTFKTLLRLFRVIKISEYILSDTNT